MRYYHETEHISVSECIDGMFVITINDPEPEVKPRYYYQTHSDYLMDALGRISDVGFDNIETDVFLGRRRHDGTFIATKNKVKYLIDKNSRVLAEDIESASEFDENGYACVEFKDRSFWLDRDGNRYGEEFEDVGWFDHGYAPVKLKNGKSTFVNSKFEPVGVEFDKTFILFSDKFYGAEIDGMCYVLDRNFNIISAPLDNFFVVTDYGYIIKQQEKGKFFGLEIVDMSGKKYASGKIINGYDSKMLRIQDNGYWFFNQETGKIIGGEHGFKSADNFNGEFTAVLLGYDERDEGIYTFVREDGSFFPQTYEYAFMMKENVGAFYVPNKTGTSGKFCLIGKDGEQIGKGSYKNLHSFGEDGLAIFRKGKDTWSAIDENFRQVDFEYEGLTHFVGGFSTIQKSGEKRKIIDKKGITLHQISQLAQKIENEPTAFLDLPEEIASDEPLMERLFVLARNSVAISIFKSTRPGETEPINYTLRALESAHTGYLIQARGRGIKHKN